MNLFGSYSQNQQHLAGTCGDVDVEDCVCSAQNVCRVQPLFQATAKISREEMCKIGLLTLENSGSAFPALGASVDELL